MPGQVRLGSFIGRRNPGGAGAEELRSIQLEQVEPARSSGGRLALAEQHSGGDLGCQEDPEGSSMPGPEALGVREPPHSKERERPARAFGNPVPEH